MQDQSITVCLNIRGAGKAIEFYKTVFGAEVVYRNGEDNGIVYHANVRIGNSMIMLNDEMVEIGALSPESVGGCPIAIRVEVENPDAVVDSALKNGAELLMAVGDKEWGGRGGMIKDPFGFRWSVATPMKG